MKLVSALTVLLMSVSALAKETTNCTDESAYPEVSRAELQQMVEKNEAFVIDVNSKDSFKKNHVPTAINFSESRKKLATLLPTDKEKTIVAYCGGPSCGAWKMAAEEVCKMGYKNIKHFKGGIKGWVEGNKKS